MKFIVNLFLKIVPHNNFRKNKARVHTNLISLTPDPQAGELHILSLFIDSLCARGYQSRKDILP